ncbi:MAG: citramalate synthase [Candidatus Ranarchaeia archaeon]
MSTKSWEVEIYDSTLRDGTQAEAISFSSEDKVLVAKMLDSIGVAYIEGGWPGSNPKDMEFFDAAKSIDFKYAKVAAFGATVRAKFSCNTDPSIQALLKAETPVITIFGKTWDLHVKDALKISLDRNLELIRDTVSYLKEYVDEVIYDAEHFFDGYRGNPEYALRTIEEAKEAGADKIVLCDTNGGNLPNYVRKTVQAVKDHFSDDPVQLGIHMHNDTECAVANTIVAVEEGVTHVQGTINGYGERCGNANLCSIIPILNLKLKRRAVPGKLLRRLTEVSRYVDELANLQPNIRQPFVGSAAFAHKGGVHVSAVLRNPETYEHIDPRRVGNRRRVLISDLSGTSNIIYKLSEYNIDIDSKDPRIRQLLKRLKEMENQGYQFEAAEASFELLVREAQGIRPKFFDLKSWRVIVEKPENQVPISEAVVKLVVNDEYEITAAEGDGPVNALDNALRKALCRFYPSLQTMSLRDYKVRILSGHRGTGAAVRVLIDSGDGTVKWGTVGVSTNIIEASYQALIDSITYKLYNDRRQLSE